MQKSVEELLSQVRVGERTTLEVTKELEDSGSGSGSGSKLIVEQRILQPEEPEQPVMRLSDKRMHVFHEVSGFSRYLRRYGSENTVIFADVEALSMCAVLNDTNQTGGYERLTFTPQVHPRWQPFAEILDETLPLDAFVNFIMRNRSGVVGGREIAMALSQVKASTTVELARGRGKTALNGLMVSVKIQGQVSNEAVELPDQLTVKLPLFVGTSPREFKLDLTLDASPDGRNITATVTSAEVADAQIAAFEEFMTVLLPLTNPPADNTTKPGDVASGRAPTPGIGAVLTMGSARNEPWAFLENKLTLPESLKQAR